MDIPKASSLTVYEIKSVLNEAGIKYPKRSKKAELVNLLQEQIDATNEKVIDTLKEKHATGTPSRRKRSSSNDLEDPIPNKKTRPNPSQSPTTTSQSLSPLTDLTASVTPTSSFKQPISPLKLSPSPVAASPVAQSPSRQLRDNTLTTPMPTSKMTTFEAPSAAPRVPAASVITKKRKSAKAAAPEPETWPEEEPVKPQIFRGFVILAIWILVAYAFLQTFYNESYPVRSADGVPYCDKDRSVTTCYRCPEQGLCENGFLVGCGEGYTLKSKYLTCVPTPNENVVNAIRQLGRDLMNNEHCPNADETSITGLELKKSSGLSDEDIEVLLKNLNGEPIRFDAENDTYFWVNQKMSCTIISFFTSNKRMIIASLVVLISLLYYYHSIKVKDASRIDELRGALLWNVKKAGGQAILKNDLQSTMKSDYPGIYEDYYWARAYDQLQRDNRVQCGVDTIRWTS